MSYLEALFSLKGKTALVTGARTGIGQAVALAFSKVGANLILLGHQNNMQETERLIQSVGGKFRSVQIDLSREDDIEESIDTFLRDNVIDVLVNNAGIIRRAQAVEVNPKDWHQVINTNLHAVFRLTTQIAKPMIDRGAGKIINIASLLSFQGGVFVPAYTASKHAVAGLTKAWANEWASLGIQVNAIAPGYIATNNTEALRDDGERSNAILNRIPAGRWGTAEDISGAALFLASSASDYMNGHVMVVDGGWMGR